MFVVKRRRTRKPATRTGKRKVTKCPRRLAAKRKTGRKARTSRPAKPPLAPVDTESAPEETDERNKDGAI
jgi:hypothetical protein